MEQHFAGNIEWFRRPPFERVIEPVIFHNLRDPRFLTNASPLRSISYAIRRHQSCGNFWASRTMRFSSDGVILFLPPPPPCAFFDVTPRFQRQTAAMLSPAVTAASITFKNSTRTSEERCRPTSVPSSPSSRFFSVAEVRSKIRTAPPSAG